MHCTGCRQAAKAVAEAEAFHQAELATLKQELARAQRHAARAAAERDEALAAKRESAEAAGQAAAYKDAAYRYRAEVVALQAQLQEAYQQVGWLPGLGGGSGRRGKALGI